MTYVPPEYCSDVRCTPTAASVKGKGPTSTRGVPDHDLDHRSHPGDFVGAGLSGVPCGRWVDHPAACHRGHCDPVAFDHGSSAGRVETFSLDPFPTTGAAGAQDGARGLARFRLIFLPLC